jgi:RNA polymerase sigma-70 factor (ECF subfamily)
LTRIAINEALSRLRKSQRFGSLDNQTNRKEDGSFSMESTQPSPEDEASSRELRSILTAAIDSLPQELRMVFVLREIEGLSTLATSEALQLSSEAVRVRLHRARLTLRRAVENQVGKEVQALFTFAGTRCDRTVAQVLRKVGLPLPPALK